MKELVKTIKNAEARFQILELQMKENKEAHDLLLERIEHNCLLAKENFETINVKLDVLGSNLDKLAWVPWFVKTLLGAGIVAVIALIFELIKRGVL